MKVEVYAAGDHFHSDPKGAAELVEMLLTKAGYTKDLAWSCRIDKMKHCDSISSPIRVIGYKDFGVYLRVKPGPNDTKDHQMTLLIPDGSGYSAENLFNQLKGCCKSISRHWRQELRHERLEETVTVATMPPEEVAVIPSIPLALRDTPVEEPVPSEEASEEQAELDFSHLRGIINKPDKLKFVLEKIQKINEGGRSRTKNDFIKTLQQECDWSSHLLRTVSRVISELLKFEYVEEIRSGTAIVGYDLTAAGHTLMGHPVPEVQQQPPEPEEEIDLGLLLRQFTSKAQELADIGRRLDAIEDERVKLRGQLAALDTEYDRLAAIIKNKEFAPAIKRLMGVKEFPLQGTVNKGTSSGQSEGGRK